MELEIYEALTAVNVPADKARAVVDSINKEIDKRYSLHAAQLATRGDLHEAKGALEVKIAQAQAEIIKWCVGTMFAAVGLFATITKLWH
ncbi:hypothetical protein [Acidovorax sp. SUPP3334]|uniref:hypothetical protein n=1 Tax=Acidovorax sp. SUPP3334 TaxID=2920881 RepID=UPI0023DE6632|nr:hypothetical protein [Acidovorax sp. SUPP3334]GKT25033.1 hypothetical protein AVHM3334_16655 [Acidovorax sp. SUPP3334]